jgi:hypothetical protein
MKKQFRWLAAFLILIGLTYPRCPFSLDLDSNPRFRRKLLRQTLLLLLLRKS